MHTLGAMGTTWCEDDSLHTSMPIAVTPMVASVELDGPGQHPCQLARAREDAAPEELHLVPLHPQKRGAGADHGLLGDLHREALHREVHLVARAHLHGAPGGEGSDLSLIHI